MDYDDRRRFIEMARRRAKPGSGSLTAVLREGSPTYGNDLILPDLGDIRFALVGGLATAHYMPERMTLVADILVHADYLEETEGRLREAGYERVGGLSIGGSTWRVPGGRCLDVIALDQPWVRHAVDSALRDEGGVPCIGLAYLVIMKLAAGRLQDLADISRMLGCADKELLAEVRKIVSEYRPQDLEDTESMIQLGKLEHESREPDG